MAVTEMKLITARHLRDHVTRVEAMGFGFPSFRTRNPVQVCTPRNPATPSCASSVVPAVTRDGRLSTLFLTFPVRAILCLGFSPGFSLLSTKAPAYRRHPRGHASLAAFPRPAHASTYVRTQAVPLTAKASDVTESPTDNVSDAGRTGAKQGSSSEGENVQGRPPVRYIFGVDPDLGGGLAVLRDDASETQVVEELERAVASGVVSRQRRETGGNSAEDRAGWTEDQAESGADMAEKNADRAEESDDEARDSSGESDDLSEASDVDDTSESAAETDESDDDSMDGSGFANQIQGSGVVVDVARIPVVKVKVSKGYRRRANPIEMRNLILGLGIPLPALSPTTLQGAGEAEGAECVAYLEDLSSLPHDGFSSIQQSAYQVGLWMGLFTALGVRVVKVRPRKWKERYGLLRREKEDSRQLARALYPQAAPHLERKKDHGLAEALLIAQYGLHRERHLIRRRRARSPADEHRELGARIIASLLEESDAKVAARWLPVLVVDGKLVGKDETLELTAKQRASCLKFLKAVGSAFSKEVRAAVRAAGRGVPRKPETYVQYLVKLEIERRKGEDQREPTDASVGGGADVEE